MNICETHDIAYMGRSCPVCATEDQIKSLEDNLTLKNETITDLEEKIEELEKGVTSDKR